MRSLARKSALALLLWMGASTGALAGSCFWSHMDRRVALDESGIWKPSIYRGAISALTLAQVGGAVWEGAETRFGKTMWQGIDAEIIAGVTSEAGKYAFQRVRPAVENDPCDWFHGGSSHSFPSGEASVAAALVTPYILEYGRDDPATYLLAAIPVWVGAARVKNQAHWQSDVLAGWAVGALSGWYAHSRDQPILIQLLPHGVAVGLHRQF